MRYWIVDSERVPEGPIDRAEIERRIIAERIEPSRLVYPEGGQAWIEAREAFPALFTSPRPPTGERFGSEHLSDPELFVSDESARPLRTSPPTTPPPPLNGMLPTPTGAGTLGYLVPVGVEPCSFAAGYLGLLSMIGGCAAPFAMGFAIAGLVRLRSRSHLRGHVRCVIGLIGGILGLGIAALLAIAASR